MEYIKLGNINYSYKGKKKIIIVLKMTQLFWDTLFLQTARLLWDGGSKIFYFFLQNLKDKIIHLIFITFFPMK